MMQIDKLELSDYVYFQLMTLFYCKIMILLSGFAIPHFCRFHVNSSPNAFFIKAGKIKLSVPIAMFSCSFCPIKCFLRILFYT